MVSILLLQHRGNKKPAVIHENIQPVELSLLMHSIFSDLEKSEKIIGIRRPDQNHYNNLALVCASPQNFTGRWYIVVTEVDENVVLGSVNQKSTSNVPLAVAPVKTHPSHALDSIEIHRIEVELMDTFYNLTKLNKIPVSKLLEIFGGCNDAITKQKYLECVDSLLEERSPRDLTRSETSITFGIFNTIFEVFDDNSLDKVDVKYLICALMCLVFGSKSDKLSYAFELFDENLSGLLTKEQLSSYFQTFLVTITVLSNLSKLINGDSEHQDDLSVAAWFTNRRALISDACAYLVHEISESISSTSLVNTTEKKISFEEFGNWYTNGGYNDALWLELIDSRKWPFSRVQTHSHADKSNILENRFEEEITQVTRASETSIANESKHYNTLQFIMPETNYKLSITTVDGGRIRTIVESSSLKNISIVDVFKIIQKYSNIAHSKQNFLSRSNSAILKMDVCGFNNAINDLIGSDVLRNEKRQAISKVLHQLFFGI